MILKRGNRPDYLVYQHSGSLTFDIYNLNPFGYKTTVKIALNDFINVSSHIFNK